MPEFPIEQVPVPGRPMPLPLPQRPDPSNIIMQAYQMEQQRRAYEQQQQQKAIQDSLETFQTFMDLREKRQKNEIEENRASQLLDLQKKELEENAAYKKALREQIGKGVALSPFYTDPETGMKFRVKQGSRGSELIPLPGQVIGPEGKTVFTTSQEKATRPSQTEFAARGFADKARQADMVLNSLVSKGFDPAGPEAGLGAILPNFAKTSSVQQSEQALRQFVNAILRRESGAAIPQAELENYRKQYWPSFGDSREVLSQKTNARRIAITGLEKEGERVSSAIDDVSLEELMAERARRKERKK